VVQAFDFARITIGASVRSKFAAIHLPFERINDQQILGWCKKRAVDFRSPERLSDKALPKSRRSPMIENSPPIYQWDQQEQEWQSVKRTVERKSNWLPIYSVVRFMDSISTSSTFPSAKSLGYFHSSARADSKLIFCKAIGQNDELRF